MRGAETSEDNQQKVLGLFSFNYVFHLVGGGGVEGGDFEGL